MDLLNGNLKEVFHKYLIASIGSALVVSIYSSVDIMAVGHYCGPDGAAALSIVNPLWPIMTVLGIILGMGGSIRMSSKRGANLNKQADTYLRTSVLTGLVCTVCIMIFMITKMDMILLALGATSEIIDLAREYGMWLAFATPAFLMERIISGFITNDGEPALVTKAAIIGGTFNIFGDIFFVYDFGLGMGMSGAGLATALGQVIAICVQLTYFKSDRCTLVWKKSQHYWNDLVDIFKSGIGVAFLSCVEAMAITIYNRRIMVYGSVVELSIFGTISSFKWVIGSLFFGMGMATQPLVSANYGAKNYERVKEVRTIFVRNAMLMGIVFGLLTMFIPKVILNVYMSVTPDIIRIGTKALRLYAIGLFVMGINIVSSYYLDAQLQSKKSLMISLLRELLLVTCMLYIFPNMFGVESIFWIMPIAEGLTLIYSLVMIHKYPVEIA